MKLVVLALCVTHTVCAKVVGGVHTVDGGHMQRGIDRDQTQWDCWQLLHPVAQLNAEWLFEQEPESGVGLLMPGCWQVGACAGGGPCRVVATAVEATTPQEP